MMMMKLTDLNRWTKIILAFGTISSTLKTISSNQLSTADLYLSTPSTTTTTTTTTTTISDQPILDLTTSEFNAILSHKLNISQFESLPQSLYPNTIKSQLILGNPHSTLPHQSKNLVIFIYGSNAQDLLPAKFILQSQSFKLPNPPDSLSFDALVSVYIARIVDSLKLPIQSIYGVKDFLQAYHDGIGVQLSENLEQWASDWNESLSEWLKWGQDLILNQSSERSSIKDSSNSLEEKFTALIKDYGPLDSAASQLIHDFQILNGYYQKISTSDPTSTPIDFLRLASLQHVQRRHGQSSIQYRTAVSALKDILSVILLDEKVVQMNKIIVALPAQPVHTRLGKRNNLSILSPFKTSEQSFIKRELIDRRRAIFGSSMTIPIIPSSRKCFSTKDQCEKDTQSCHSHGACVEGQKTSGGKCFVCSCQKSRNSKTGQVSHWSGDMCQKEDISSGFMLLFGSALGLIILFGLAIRLLLSIGSQGLPQQLSSVSGSSKKMD